MSAAVILGISLTVKPLLAPLLLVLLLARRWRESAVAVLIPAVLSAITLVIVVAVNADPSKFWHNVTSTFSDDTGKPWNMSLGAMAGYIHAPNAVGDVVRVIVTAICLIVCWRLWKRPRDEGGVQAVLLTAPLFVIVVLSFSFSWGYYCLLLLPLGFVSLRRDRSSDWVVRRRGVPRRGASAARLLHPGLSRALLPGRLGPHFRARHSRSTERPRSACSLRWRESLSTRLPTRTPWHSSRNPRRRVPDGGNAGRARVSEGAASTVAPSFVRPATAPGGENLF